MNENEILKNEEEIPEEKLNILEEYISGLQSEKTSDVFEKIGEDAELLSLMKTARDMKVMSTSQTAYESMKIKAHKDTTDVVSDDKNENYKKTHTWKWIGFGLVFTGVGVAVLGFIFLTENIINPDAKTGTIAEKNINIQNSNAVTVNDNHNVNTNETDDTQQENDSQVVNANTNADININGNADTDNLNNGIAETTNEEPVLAVGGADAEEMSVTAAAVGITDPQEYAQYEKDITEDLDSAEQTEENWNNAIEDTVFISLEQDLESFDF